MNEVARRCHSSEPSLYSDCGCSTCTDIYIPPAATQPSYHPSNGSQKPLCFASFVWKHVCVCVLTSSNCCVEIPPKPLEGFFLSWLYPLVECPISFSLIPFPDPQTPAALMWHHRKVYLAGTHVWSEHRGKAGWCLYLAGEELNQNVVNEHIKCEPHDKRKIKIIQLP